MVLPDPSVPLFISEGAKKVDAATSIGLVCVGVMGVWGWRGTNERGGRAALGDWDAIPLNARRAILAFDSDVMAKAEVHKALVRLRQFLDSRGADVWFVYLPEASDDE